MFLSNQSQHFMLDGCRSKLSNVVSCVPKDSVMVQLFFLLIPRNLFPYWETSLTVMQMATVPSPGVRATVPESLNRDLGKVSEWCDICAIKLNASKTKTMIVSRSRTIHPLLLSLTIGDTVLKGSDDLDISGLIFDSKTFAKHLR